MLIVKGKRPYVCPSYKNVIAFKNIYELSERVKEYNFIWASSKVLNCLARYSVGLEKKKPKLSRYFSKCMEIVSIVFNNAPTLL